MNKRVMIAIGITLSLVAAGLVSIGGFVYTSFYRYQLQVDDLLINLPKEEINLSPTVIDVIDNAENKTKLRNYLCMRLVVKFHEVDKMRPLETNLHEAIWQQLLPKRLTHEQLVSLYSHFM